MTVRLTYRPKHWTALTLWPHVGMRVIINKTQQRAVVVDAREIAGALQVSVEPEMDKAEAVLASFRGEAKTEARWVSINSVTETEAAKWHTDSIQFPRLLAEIRAVGLTPDQYNDLRDSMDLNQAEIDEVLERAETAWEKIKER